MDNNKNLRDMNSEENQRLTKMRQAMFKAFSEASKDNNEQNSFYDISQGEHFINLVQNKPIIKDNMAELVHAKSRAESDLEDIEKIHDEVSQEVINQEDAIQDEANREDTIQEYADLPREQMVPSLPRTEKNRQEDFSHELTKETTDKGTTDDDLLDEYSTNELELKDPSELFVADENDDELGESYKDSYSDKKGRNSLLARILNKFKDEHIKESEINTETDEKEHGSAFLSLNKEEIEKDDEKDLAPALEVVDEANETVEVLPEEQEVESLPNENEGKERGEQDEEIEKVTENSENDLKKEAPHEERNLDDLAHDDKLQGDKQDEDLKKIVDARKKELKHKFVKFKQNLQKQFDENKQKSKARREDFKKANEEIRQELDSEHSETLPLEERRIKEKYEASDNPHHRLKLKNNEISRRKELLKARITFFVIASVLLLTPFFYILIKPMSIYSEGEKRALSLFPQVTLDSVLSGDFMRDFEKYSNDQFPLRREFLAGNYLMRRALLNKDNSSVIFGKDSYLFNKTKINDDGQYYKNVEILAELDEAVGRGDYGNREVYCAIVPNKEVILSDKLPLNMPRRDQDLYQKLIEKTCQNINYVDMKNSLLDAENKARTFYMTDHHWTSYGAFVGSNSIFSAMNLNLLYADRFEKNVVKSDFLGSLIAKSGKISLKKDEIEIWRNKEFEVDPNSTLEVRSENDVVLRTGLYEPQALDADSPYDVFAGGEFPFLSFHSSSAEDTQGDSILIIKDSFADETLPFMTQRFAHIYYLDPRYSNLSISDVLAEHPNISKVLILMNFNSFADEANFSKIIN